MSTSSASVSVVIVLIGAYGRYATAVGGNLSEIEANNWISMHRDFVRQRMRVMAWQFDMIWTGYLRMMEAL